ncbi:hypothetical protein [Pantoea sp. Sc1]|uniref:hypothetical protein n=1 Tax=Pantoea sp. Sc1 TaxID=593105 RepID=UPI0011467AB3|nr:hypothetical protein [Pantoea sp. Sc1]
MMVAIFTEKVMAEEGAERLKNVEVLCQQGVLIPLPAEQEADVSIWGNVLNAGWWWEKDSNLRSL